ncbi:hypothetical protein [uncultured Holdemanella sp.]|jgi:hypothetical protein|uniref:hypothetical protein n=1 Tax=uncultured Holdemanella sp. TaxID=1763549 RepID=UPI0025FF3CD2|nr:hypothetical protein [uncultured Holdemanella sp.]
MTSQEKKPRKNKKSQFEIELKRYLSSLSARGDKFIYCNIPAFPGLIIITNADFSLITKYEPVTLSMHLIYTKENTTYNFYDDFMEFFHIKDSPLPYIFRSESIMRALRNNRIEETQAVIDTEGNIKIMIGDEIVSQELVEFSNEESDEFSEETVVDKEENPFEEDEKADEALKDKIIFTTDIAGKVIDDNLILIKLENIVSSILDRKDLFEGTDVSSKILAYKQYAFNEMPDGPLVSNWFKTYPIKAEDFITKDGQPAFKEKFIDCHFLYIDGLDGPSIKEFISKTPNSENFAKLFVWTDNGLTLKSIVRYEDENVVITSCRPFVELVPLRKHKRRIKDSK